MNKFRPAATALALCLCAAAAAMAQPAPAPPQPPTAGAAQLAPADSSPYFDKIYQNFNNTYRLGPGDEISIRIKGQPDPALEKTKVSPTGTVYLELLGEVSVAGMTTSQIAQRLTGDLSEYLKNPSVSVQLVDAVSAKIGVLGEVRRPGIIVMSRPMTLLDAITEAGGLTDLGSSSSVEIIRQNPNGSRSPMRVNVKKILDGTATPEYNLQMRAGDTVMVHGNSKKTLTTISTVAGLGTFITFVAKGW
jgi:polysaccharide export outer membrane protein